jgi:trk system potassium uptake protein TrkH
LSIKLANLDVRVILSIVGALLIFLALTMIIPALISLVYDENDWLAFIITAGISGFSGTLLFFIFKGSHDLRLREGFALVTFAWLAFAFFGALPFYLSDYIPSYTDAFFETMSGFTTTGASILTDIEKLPHGLLFWRSFTHWIGGMGIILLSLAILPLLGVAGMQLYKAEVPGPEHDKLKPRLKDTAKILWEVYILITVVEIILLYLAGMNVFDAICHTFGTMATGGFSTKNASVGYYQNATIDYIIVVFMLIAGINFSLHYRALRGRIGCYWQDAETKFFFLIIGIGTLIIMTDLYFSGNYTLSKTLQSGLFQSVSIITTTGYGTDDYEKWSSSSQIVLFLFMFLGGCAGSTGGAIKIMRSLVMLKFAGNEIKKLIHPNAVLPIRIGKRTIPQEVVGNITGFFMIYIGIFVLGVVSMTMLGLDFTSALGSVAATLGNIGPGLGSVGPTDNYAHIPQLGKWLLAFIMLVGRLEIFPVIIFLSPTFWKK